MAGRTVGGLAECRHVRDLDAGGVGRLDPRVYRRQRALAHDRLVTREARRRVDDLPAGLRRDDGDGHHAVRRERTAEGLAEGDGVGLASAKRRGGQHPQALDRGQPEGRLVRGEPGERGRLGRRCLETGREIAAVVDDRGRRSKRAPRTRPWIDRAACSCALVGATLPRESKSRRPVECRSRLTTPKLLDVSVNARTDSPARTTSRRAPARRGSDAEASHALPPCGCFRVRSHAAAAVGRRLQRGCTTAAS